MRSRLLEIYQRLLRYFGHQDWWPARTRFEVITGAILTQNTNWKNVEKAIANLRKAGLLSPERLAEVSEKELCEYIRPSGFYKQKAKRLKCFLDFLKKYRYNLSLLFREDVHSLRRKLLALNGIGPETADSILLYAGNKLSFVIDAYTKRIFLRLGMGNPEGLLKYEQLQNFFQRNIPQRVDLYKEYHALLVELAKKHCRKEPVCNGCPLVDVCKFYRLTH